MFDESVAKEEMKRLMLVPDAQEQLPFHLIELEEFVREDAIAPQMQNFKNSCNG